MSETNSTFLVEVRPGRNSRFTVYLCQRCNREKEICKYSVQYGKTRSCGCLSASCSRARFTTHGMTSSPTYAAWCDAKTRATNPNRECSVDYVERGITMCCRWLESFEAFHADMGAKPSRKMTVERMDNNGGYWCGKPECPECGPLGRTPNCKWGTRWEQAKNTRRSRLYTLNGRTMCRLDWAREIGITDGGLKERIERWGIEKALSTPKLEAGWNGYATRGGTGSRPGRKPKISVGKT